MPQAPWLPVEGGRWGPILDMHSSSYPGPLAPGSENLVRKPQALSAHSRYCAMGHTWNLSVSAPPA